MSRTLLIGLLGLIVSRDGSASSLLDLGPPPSAPAPREVAELGTSPLYHRLPADKLVSVSRSSIGSHTRWSGGRDTSFTFDALLGGTIRFARDTPYGLWFEGGYSYVRSGQHLAVFGAGVARRERGSSLPSMFALVPHFVIGRVDGEPGMGLRTSLLATVVPYGIELAHQVLVVDRRAIHETHLVVTFPLVGGT